jgi:hypothetical protein
VRCQIVTVPGQAALAQPPAPDRECRVVVFVVDSDPQRLGEGNAATGRSCRGWSAAVAAPFQWSSNATSAICRRQHRSSAFARSWGWQPIAHCSNPPRPAAAASVAFIAALKSACDHASKLHRTQPRSSAAEVNSGEQLLELIQRLEGPAPAEPRAVSATACCTARCGGWPHGDVAGGREHRDSDAVRAQCDHHRVLEGCVGIMLVVLGLDVARRVLRGRVHFHVHEHAGGIRHFHAHSHAAHDQSCRHHQHHHGHTEGFPKRALVIGLMHGLAGSAALILLALRTTDSAGLGLLYMAVFGIGSMIGMALLSAAIAVPFNYLRAASRGFAPGHDLDDWLAAEQIVDARLASESESI